MKKLLKLIYFSKFGNIFRKSICLALRNRYLPPRYLLHLFYFDGNFAVHIDDQYKFYISHAGRWVENSLFWHNLSDYEPVSLKIWRDACRFSNLILDIGANSGLYSLVAKCVNSSSTVYAFEPLEEFSSLIKKNIKLNSYDVRIIESAVSDVAGLADFYVPQQYQGNIYSSTLSVEHYGKHQQTEPIIHQVNVTTLDNFIEDNHLGNIDLIKIDAEGHDLNVLRGFVKYLRKMQPDFLIEIQDEYTGQQIREILDPITYLYWAINDQSHRIERTEFLYSVNCRNFLICKQETAQKLHLL